MIELDDTAADGAEARPIVAGVIEALQDAGRRVNDVFLSGAIRRAVRTLARTDQRLAAAEAWAAQLQAERDGLERQRDELRRELRAAKAVRDARPIGTPRLTIAATNGEPLAARTRERDEARSQRDALIAAGEADRATIAGLRAQLEASEDQLKSEPVSSAAADVQTDEAVLNARRAAIVAEKDEIVAELGRAARDPATSRNRWEAKAARDALVRRLGEIDVEIRELNPRLRAMRIARQERFMREAGRA